jgi:acetyltransferase-like isoleucine patch superfamily enzyme
MKVYGGRYLLSAELASLGLRTVGADVQIHSTCIMVGLENISIGDHVRIDAFSSLIAGNGRIAIGSHVHIAGYGFLSGAEGIEIADFVNVSRGVGIYTRNDDYAGEGLAGPTIPAEFLKQATGPVSLGRHVIVGSGSIVLPGVTIAEGSTVGALSLVKTDLAAWGIYAGVPVRRLRGRSRALLAFDEQLALQERQAGLAAQLVSDQQNTA